ncbi:MAG: hypothetical protein MZV64_33765 [Ignavibacteriales bacterium]|nr:hypothetical protein [Ignavibacteriales bacterium]
MPIRVPSTCPSSPRSGAGRRTDSEGPVRASDGGSLPAGERNAARGVSSVRPRQGDSIRKGGAISTRDSAGRPFDGPVPARLRIGAAPKESPR